MLRFLAVLALLIASVAPALAQPVRTPHVEVELHSARAAIAPGETFTVVLRQTIIPGWHTYWLNPGDAGEPTALDWRVPDGGQAGPILWPAPDAIPFLGLVNYGYSNEVLLPLRLTAPASARPGESIAFVADATWVVCEQECVLEQGTLSLTVPVSGEGRDDPNWAPRIAAAVADLPVRVAGVEATVVAGDPAKLLVAIPDLGEVRNPRFFPFERDPVQAAAPQRPRFGERGLSFNLTPGVGDDLGRAALGGLVTFEQRMGDRWVKRAIEIEAQPATETPQGFSEQPADISGNHALAEIEGAAEAASEPPGMSGVAIAVALGLAFLGGLVLNIMPCVLPVLSMKALAFAGGVRAGEARRHGLFYFVGVMTAFMALAGVLLALRGAGEAIGWGFQLQSPWITASLALLFFVIGLNLLGVFEVGGLQDAGGGLASRGGDAGAFFTGALAAIAATPCTAPFMAGAVGAALTQPAPVALSVFAALGAGFAAPLTLLHLAPGLQRLIPKPGAWMERARNVLAFPMFAAAVWLAWVLAEQTGPMGVLSLLSLAVAIGLALLVARWGRGWVVAGVIIVLMTGAFTWRPLLGMAAPAALAAEAWRPERVAELRAEGRGVFVNFTAAWCITCKVNELTALSAPQVADAFARSNVAYLKGDWTNRDEAIAEALAEHGRAGVPLYLYYPPDGEPLVLPQVLSEALIVETITGEGQ